MSSISSVLMTAAPGRLPTPRPLWKTMLFGTLFMFLPIVGGGLSAIYWFTRDEPETYRSGNAGGAALLSIVGSLVTAAIVVALCYFLAIVTGNA